MANSVDEAVDEAIAELKAQLWVIDAVYDTGFSEDKPGGYVLKRINVFHKTSGGHTFSPKMLYINKLDYTWKWHYGGAAAPASTTTRDFFMSKLVAIKTAAGLDHLEILSINEDAESSMLLAIKTDVGQNAITYTVKAWKTGATTFDWKIISKTTVT